MIRLNWFWNEAHSSKGKVCSVALDDKDVCSSFLIRDSTQATLQFLAWLTAQIASKTGYSQISVIQFISLKICQQFSHIRCTIALCITTIKYVFVFNSDVFCYTALYMLFSKEEISGGPTVVKKGWVNLTNTVLQKRTTGWLIRKVLIWRLHLNWFFSS